MKPEVQQMKSQLSPSKQQLLQKLLSLPAAPAIPQQPKRPKYPLSFAQHRFWMASQLESGTAVYSMVRAFRLTGALDVPALRKSLADLICRHAALRTRFRLDKEGPVQFVADVISHPWSEADLTAVEAPHRGRALADLLQREASSPFDLDLGPPLRLVLVVLGKDDHALILVIHHIAGDDWSTQILFRELSTLYNNVVSGKDLPLAQVSIEYTDFAIWQRRLVEDGELASQMAYWKQQLADLPPPLNLPARIKSMPPSLSGARLSSPVSGKLWDGLKGLIQGGAATLFEILLAAFEVLLAYYTGEDDIVIATVVSNRDRQELENLVGCLVNTVVLRVRLADDSTLMQVARQIRELMLDVQRNKDIPFEYLLKTLQDGAEVQAAPPVRVLFALQNAHDACLSLSGIQVESMIPEHGASTFDLTFAPEQTRRGLNLALQYNTSLFEEQMIRRFMAHYCQVLEAFVANPDQCIADFRLATQKEKEEQQQKSAADNALVADMLEAHAARVPNAVAAIFGSKALSYRELNQRANRLAGHLRGLGAGPEARVAICLGRGLEMIVAIWGVLKSGAAYVPLDSVYPPERLNFMLQDSGSQILLTQKSLIQQLPPFAGMVIALDAEWAQIGFNDSQNLPRTLHPDNAAYIIYTSGSTGKPKGAVIRHGSAATFIRWAQEVFSADELSGMLASTSLCFDLSIFEILVPLATGGSVVVAENALELATMPEPGRVTLLNTVPSIMRELVLMKAIPASLRTINLAGEALPPELVQAIYAAHGTLRVFNLYGPTESTTYSTFALLPRSHGSRTIPIGKPVTGTQVYILNRWRQPLPEDVVGELYIGGNGLARGYLNRPDLTAERFVPNPLGQAPGERLYRTGDLVRLRANGDLEFLGRIDHQVKIRGYRIELGEIELALQEHESVDQAVVIVCEDERGGKKLLAYLTSTGKGQITLEELTGHLRDRLPLYMVPDKVITLAAMPLTANGKVDRKRLPDPSAQAPLWKDDDPPGTVEEEILCNLWTEVLHKSPIGASEDFFALGGNSLLALQISARVWSAFGIELPVQVFLEARTVRGLARYIDRKQGEGQRLDTLMKLLQFELHQQQNAS